MEACYQIMPTVQRLWKPIFGEFDDYIVHPKPSGYQSLHTAVIGPDKVPMEVQIRTSSMHHEAEYGQAAHWAYKDAPPAPQQPPPKPDLSVGKAVRAHSITWIRVQSNGKHLPMVQHPEPDLSIGNAFCNVRWM